mmetsp:Transcript_11220/g.35748  ORF Transcript_11220/g.35748 Transcript_11220/m.35748 type:complete len:469 (+) Transcript_11220:1185-2591(+)
MPQVTQSARLCPECLYVLGSHQRELQLLHHHVSSVPSVQVDDASATMTQVSLKMKLRTVDQYIHVRQLIHLFPAGTHVFEGDGRVGAPRSTLAAAVRGCTPRRSGRLCSLVALLPTHHATHEAPHPVLPPAPCAPSSDSCACSCSCPAETGTASSRDCAASSIRADRGTQRPPDLATPPPWVARPRGKGCQETGVAHTTGVRATYEPTRLCCCDPTTHWARPQRARRTAGRCRPCPSRAVHARRGSWGVDGSSGPTTPRDGDGLCWQPADGRALRGEAPGHRWRDGAVSRVKGHGAALEVVVVKHRFRQRGVETGRRSCCCACGCGGGAVPWRPRAAHGSVQLGGDSDTLLADQARQRPRGSYQQRVGKQHAGAVEHKRRHPPSAVAHIHACHEQRDAHAVDERSDEEEGRERDGSSSGSASPRLAAPLPPSLGAARRHRAADQRYGGAHGKQDITSQGEGGDVDVFG